MVVSTARRWRRRARAAATTHVVRVLREAPAAPTPPSKQRSAAASAAPCVCVGGARRAFVVGPGRRSSYLLLHVRRDARACGARSEVLGLQCMGVGARARGGCPFCDRRGARGGGAAGRSYGSPPPMVVACRARKGSLSAAFTHEPCSCGSPAPRSGSGVAPAATSTRCSVVALYGSGAADVAFRPAPPRRGRPHAIDAQLPSP